MIDWQEPPPYVQFMTEAEAIGRASYLGGVCTAFGLVASSEADVEALVDDFLRRAIIAKVEGPMLAQAITDGSDREEAAVKVIMDLGPDDGSATRQRREAQLVEYFGNGCADLTIDYPDTFRWVAD